MGADLPARRVVNAAGKSEWMVTEAGLSVVEELSARGCSVVTIARALGFGKDAFRSVRNRQPEVEEALENGRAREHDRLVGLLHAQAEEGQYVPAMFLLKTRFGYREGEPFEANVNVSVNTGGVIVVPDKMSMEDFLAERREAGMLDHAPRPGTVERVPGGGVIEGIVDPETRRGD